MEIQRITKLEAARRQLETAVRLYFHDGDPIAIHALAAAANELTRGVNKSRGGTTATLHDWLVEHIKPERASEFAQLFNKSQNFFKHADRDPEAVLDFSSDEAQTRLLGACVDYHAVAQDSSPVLKVFEVYSALTWGRDLVEDGWSEMLPLESRERWAVLPRPTFFAEFLTALEEPEAGGDA